MALGVARLTPLDTYALDEDRMAISPNAATRVTCTGNDANAVPTPELSRFGLLRCVTLEASEICPKLSDFLF